MRLVLAATVIVGLGLGALAWRLEQEPLSLPWVARQVEQALNRGSTRIEIGDAAIAWAGWREGHRSPVEICMG